MLVVNEQIAIPLDEFQFEYSRSGGPGGQNVNKVNSRVVLRWKPGESASLTGPVRERLLKAVGSKLTVDGELLVSSQKTRDQGRNVEDCMEKLRQLVLAAAIPPKARKRTKPTYASRLRRAEGKSRRSATKRLRRAPESES